MRKSEALLDELIALRPGFAEAWEDEKWLWTDNNDTFSCHGVFSAFSTYMIARIRKENKESLSEVFEFVEGKMVEDNPDVRDAAATCFLENLLNVTPDEIRPRSYVPLLGEESREFCRAWDKFCGVKTEGLWDEEAAYYDVIAPRIMLRTLLLLTVGSLLFGACHQDIAYVEPPPPPVHTVRIEGRVTLDAEVGTSSAETHSLVTRVWAKNIGADTAHIETGPCAFRVLAYDSEDPAAGLVWHNMPPGNYICPDVGHLHTVAPGDRVEFADQQYLSGSKWRTDLPAGRWYFVVEAVTETDSTLTIPAGHAVAE